MSSVPVNTLSSNKFYILFDSYDCKVSLQISTHGCTGLLLEAVLATDVSNVQKHHMRSISTKKNCITGEIDLFSKHQLTWSPGKIGLSSSVLE